MITELQVYGFRILKNFIWRPKTGLNILVGANSAGKSTVLDAIELVTRGSVRGQNARRAISPDWFNQQCVDEFFRALESECNNPDLPEIKIVVTFAGEPALARITGCCGPDGCVDNAPGMYLTYKVPDELRLEFLAECKSLLAVGGSLALPTDYYSCEWRVFQGDPIVRRPEGVGCTRIDTTPELRSRAVDAYAKSYVSDELDDGKLREVSSQFRRVSSQVDRDILSEIVVSCSGRSGLGLQMDRSPRTDWTNSIVLHRNGLPLSALGSAEQTLTKCSVSLQNAASESILLLEEPECHLSHTSLNELVKVIGAAVEDGRQVFITTHSPFVLNRLGLDNLSVMAEGNSPKQIPDLSKDTVRYFRRLSGYDTLRVILASKAVLVEGPTDEMVFDWAFRKERGNLPQNKGIDVIECGTQHKRLLELAAALGKGGVAALRDTDEHDPDHWNDLAEPYLSDDRKLFCGDPAFGRTIEPQMISANESQLSALSETLKSPSGRTLPPTRDRLEQYMTKNKTEWALRLLDADEEVSEKLRVPSYILDAIYFIDPIELGGVNE